MGIKFLSLQTIPWCFHVMGNHITCIHHLPHPDPPPPLHTVKIIQSDGHVKIYDRPIAASQLMLEFPKHLICHSDSFFIGQKIPALSETDELKLGHKYFLLPKHVFQSVLSFVTIASFATSPSSNNNSSSTSTTSTTAKASFVKKAASCRPFDIHKTPSGTLQIRVSDEFISKLIEEGRLNDQEQESCNKSSNKGRVCTTPELEKDYTMLVGCRRSREWKPKLETIKEKEKNKHRGAFGMKRKKDKGGQSHTSTNSKRTHGYSSGTQEKQRVAGENPEVTRGKRGL